MLRRACTLLPIRSQYTNWQSVAIHWPLWAAQKKGHRNSSSFHEKIQVPQKLGLVTAGFLPPCMRQEQSACGMHDAWWAITAEHARPPALGVPPSFGGGNHDSPFGQEVSRFFLCKRLSRFFFFASGCIAPLLSGHRIDGLGVKTFECHEFP